MSYSRFMGEPVTTETSYEYEGGRVVRSVSTSDPDWTELDRSLVVALLEERAERCSMCGHPMSVCRDPRTAGSWEVVEGTCEPSRIAQAQAENAQKAGRRGVVLGTRRTPTGGPRAT